MQFTQKILPASPNIKIKVIMLLVVFGSLFWLVESAVMSVFFKSGPFIPQIFSPSPHEIWQRVLILSFLTIFSILSVILLRQREKAENALRVSEEKYRLLVELSPDAIGIQSQDEIVYFNAAGAALFGAETIDQLEGKSIWDFILPEYQEIASNRHKEMQVRNSPAPLVELGFRRLDGTKIFAEVMVIPFLYQGRTAIQVVFRDVMHRKQAEALITRRNMELAVLNDVAKKVSRSLDLDQILHDALDRDMWLGILGEISKGLIFLVDEKTGELALAAHRGVIKDHPCLKHPPHPGECLCGRVLRIGDVIISDSKDQRHTRRLNNMPAHKDVCLPLHTRNRTFGVMNLELPVDKELLPEDVRLLTAITGQIGVAIENARLFRSVSHQREQLSTLGTRLIEAEETERKRLAKELHDQVGQNLAVLGINLNIIRSLLSDETSSNVFSRLDDSETLIEETAERTRDVMSNLRPTMLDDYGLVTALHWYGEHLSSRSGLPITIIDGGRLPYLEPVKENALFRIAQEALINAVKHSQASEVIVTLTVTGGKLRMIIADDGIGFNSAKVNSSNGHRNWGLLIMAERAEALNGQLLVESDPENGGTRIITEVDT
jgi:PAS domain S-box-containing protein